MFIRPPQIKSEKALLRGLRRGFVCGKGVGMLLVMVILGLAGLIQAQPQAPVVWGERRLLLNSAPDYRIYDIYARGDTIMLLGWIDAGTNDYTAARVTGDNGRTWSPWHVFSIERSFSFSATGAVMDNAVLCCAQVRDNSWGIYRSTDLGRTWLAPDFHWPQLRIIATLGDTVFCSRIGGIIWTVDNGVTFSPSRPLDFGSAPMGIMAGTSHQQLHLTSATRFNIYEPQRLFYTRGGLAVGNFEPLRNLTPNYAWTSSVGMQFKDDGTGMALCAVNYSLPAPDWSAMLLMISRDDGNSWSPPDTVTRHESALFLEEWVENVNDQWLLVWIDSTRQQGFEGVGAWYRFSADNGRNWYPSAQFTGDSVWRQGSEHEVDFRGNTIRAYGTFTRQNGVHGYYYTQIEGIVNIDSLVPVIEPTLLPPDSLFGQDTAWFQVASWDNDTIAAVIVYLVSASGLTDSVQLAYVGDHIYRGGWAMPETGTYCYRIRATDFWANSRTFPESDSLCFFAEPSSSIASSLILPTAFSLFAFPNPFNAQTEIRYMLPQTAAATLTVYDLAGRRVAMLADETLPAGEHVVQWDARGLPSGVYFARLNAGGFAATRKLLLLR